MSLFDVLKYPISNPPTLQELEALPVVIFDRWVIDANLWHIRLEHRPTPLSIHSQMKQYRKQWNITDLDMKYKINLLRQYILEYEPV
jgi:hypothetical protein